MNEKKFKLKDNYAYNSSILCDGKLIPNYKLIELINEQYEELTRCKRFLKNQYISKLTIEDCLLCYIDKCYAGIEEVIEGEKDSYIVKHDIAIKMLKQIGEDLGIDLDE